MMVKGGRISQGHSWEFWRLVAVIFTISFVLQLAFFVSLAQFTEYSVCYNKLSSVDLYQGVFEPAIRIPSSAFDRRAPSGLETLPRSDNSSSVNYTIVDENPSRNCSCPEIGVSQKIEHSNVSSSSRNAIALPVQSLQPLSFPLYPFVKFRAYRVKPNTFFVVGLSSQVARAFDVPVYDCQWKKDRRKKQADSITRAEMMYIRADENRMPYVTAIVNCTFDAPVGGDGEGGVLRLSVSVNPKRDSPSGTVTVDVHEETKEEFQKFNETLKKLEVSGAASLPYRYAFCGPPMHGRIKPAWILSWLSYHYRLYGGTEGKVRFFFYNTGGLTEEGRKVLEPFLKAGVVDIVDVLDEWHYPGHYHSQLLFINDCLQRTRFIAQWTLFHDFDEFLHIPPPNTLDSLLLQKYEDQPWLTFASLPASWNFCIKPSSRTEELWPLERMMWVDKQPECRYTRNVPDPYLCTGPLGRRKYAVNPRNVLSSGVHATTFSTEPGGIDLNGTIIRIHHYHGALASNTYFCGKEVNSSVHENLEGLVFDDSIAKETTKSRELLAPLLAQTQA